MRRLVIVPLVAGAAFISSILAAPAFSLDNGDVAATVTPATPCISIAAVAGGTLQFPSKTFSTNLANVISEVDGPLVTNCSGVTENIYGNGSSASNGAGGAIWTLLSPANPSNAQCVAGETLYSANKYALRHNVAAGDQRFFTESQIAVKLSAADGVQPPYKLQMYMPCSGSLGVGTAMNFTITFTATIP